MNKVICIYIVTLFLSSAIFAQGKISSKVYFNYSYNSDSSPTNSFDIHRAYLTYSNKISKGISFKITTDIGRFNTGKDNRLSLYLKNAFVGWETGIGKFVFGLQGMNMFNVEEKNWGYRFVEKTPMDLNHFASSADLGIGYYNKIGNKFNVSALVTNGTGYKKIENNKFKKFSFQAFYGNGKIFKGGYNIGASLSLESFYYPVENKTTTATKTVFGGFAAYSTGILRTGAEYDFAKNNGTNITQTIFSVYANFRFLKFADIFGRFDIFNPNTNISNNGYSYFIGGLNFDPAKGFSIAPNIKIKHPKSGESIIFYFINFEFKI